MFSEMGGDIPDLESRVAARINMSRLTSYAQLARRYPVLLALALLVVSAASAPTRAQTDDCAVGIIDTVAGGGIGVGGLATQAALYFPAGVAVGPDGSVYIADMENYRIRKVGPADIITTVAGSGKKGYAGHSTPPTEASLNHPRGVAVGADGTFYIADTDNHRIRVVMPASIVTGALIYTWVGDGTPGYSGDGGFASHARVNHPCDVAVDADGNLYIADTRNHRIRRVRPPRSTLIATVAGTGAAGWSGDGGPATEAHLKGPCGVAVGADGSVYVADTLNHRIRKVDPEGVITTVAGSGKRGYSGDGGPATKASLNCPRGVAVGEDGSLYIADTSNNRIRKVDPAGIITTMAGTGDAGYWGDGGPATEASLDYPRGVAVGGDGSLYIADAKNRRIRRVWSRPCDPQVARAKADELRAKAGDSTPAWREVAELYLIAKAWDDAQAAAERLLALMPETHEPAQMRAEVLIARAYAGKRDDHEARRRLMRILVRARDSMVLRDAADALVDLHLLRGERDQAIATLNNLAVQTQDRRLLNWLNRRLKEIAGD